MVQLNIIGGMMGTSGYDIHTRQLANALNKTHDVRLSIPVMPGQESDLTTEEIKMLKRPAEKDEINLIITNPMHWRAHTTAIRNWVYLIWEGNKIPRSWHQYCHDEEIEWIFVPSKHTLEAVPNKFHHKIKVIPHGVNTDLFYPKDKPEKFTFVALKGYRHPEDRGGIQYLAQAFKEEFKDNEAELLIKINPAYPMADLQGGKIITDVYDYKDLIDFYNKGHVFVSPTRAEAFNLPCIEAMACGLPVITTAYGGQTDYVNESNGYLVGGKLRTVKHELLYEGVKWLTPSIKELKKRMREAIQDIKGREKRSQNAILDAQNMTWDHTSKLITNLI
jgi:glycosyltransferase involved in cell wall biosynthesis